jgi:hypothetical protein
LIDSSESGYRKHKTANLAEIDGRKGETKRESVQGQVQLQREKLELRKRQFLIKEEKRRGKTRARSA